MTSCAGTCHYLQGGGCEIRLSEPLLKYRTTSDLKNTLLHEMIHAFLWITSNNKDHSDHGPTFRAIMNTINSSSVTDYQRPSDGYNITVYHEFHEEVDSYRVHHWICELCGDLIKRAMNREPSANDCIEHRGADNSCGNYLCHWHGHKLLCSGKYKKIAEPPGYKDKRRVAKGAHENDVNKFSGPSHGTKQSSGGLQGVESLKGSPDDHKCKKITKFFQSVGVADPGRKSLSGNDFGPHSSNETKHLKGMEVETVGQSSGGAEIRKKRTPGCRKQGSDTCTGKKKSKIRKREVTVAIPGLGYYADEGSEEDTEPLVNKRSERRKKEPQWGRLKGRCLQTEATSGAYPSQHSSSSDSLLCTDDAGKSKPETTPGDSREAHRGPYLSNPPINDNVVYILDD